jgi:hypothetical protein
MSTPISSLLPPTETTPPQTKLVLEEKKTDASLENTPKILEVSFFTTISNKLSLIYINYILLFCLLFFIHSTTGNSFINKIFEKIPSSVNNIFVRVLIFTSLYFILSYLFN